MEISVQGMHEANLRPEIGRLHASAQAEGSTKDEVLRKVTDAVAAFSAELKRLAALPEAPVRDVVVRPITTSSWRPVNRGRMQPPIFTASSQMRADFSDFGVLADIAAQYGAIDGLNLGWVEWDLTDETRRRVEGECLTKAVTEAKERALVLARAAGDHEVRFVQLADPGLLGDAQPQAAMMSYDGMARGGAMRSMKGGEAELSGVEIAPEDITLSASVHARFTSA